MTDIDTRGARPRAEARFRGAADPLAARGPARHGYELSKLIHTRSGGQLTFHIDSLYPLLYRLEERGWIKGTWVEKAGRAAPPLLQGDRRRAARPGRSNEKTWAAFVEAVRRVTGDEHA